MAIYDKKTAEIPLEPPKPVEKNFLYQREAGVWIYLIQAVVVMAFAFFGALLWGYKAGWMDLWFDAALIAWASGGLYFAYSLWRWNKLSWLETKLGVNLDRDPRIGNGEMNGKRPTLYVRIQMPDGSTRAAESELEAKQRNLQYLRWIAAATVAGRPNSQRAMQRGGVHIPRPKHEKAMALFVRLGLLRKEYPGQANSRYVIAEPVAQNRAVLRAVANGEYAVLEDLWDAEGQPNFD